MSDDGENPDEEKQLSSEEALVNEPSFLQKPATKSATINPLTLEPRLAVSDEVAAEEENRAVGICPPSEEGTLLEPSTENPNEYFRQQLAVFFTELQESFSERYEMWENSMNAVLTVMRKMQSTTIVNSKQLFTSIEDVHKRVTTGLEKFEIKRNAIEEYSGADFRGTVKKLKQILGILKLQVEEYELKTRVDTYLRYIAGFSG